MTNEFIALRARAREKRDRAIAQARADYAETLTRIAALEQDLLGRVLSSHRSIAACIDSVIPQDREFTTADVMAGLEALDPGRVWLKRSVDSHLSRLRERGIVRRVRRARPPDPAIYVRMGAETPPRPFEDQTLVEVMEAKLRERPMNPTELAVAILEGGYETQMTPKRFRTAVLVQLRAGKDHFRKEGDKWGCGK
jgi:hypothetical protein